MTRRLLPLLCLLLAGCGAQEPAAVKAKHHRIAIEIKDFRYTPQTIEATPGRSAARRSPTTAASPTRCGCRAGPRTSSPRPRACCRATAPQDAQGPQGPLPLLLRALQPRGARDVRDADRQVRPVEPNRFRTVMGHFATGVAVVTVDTPARPDRHDRQRGRLAQPRPGARCSCASTTARARCPRCDEGEALRRQRARRRPGAPRAPLRVEGGHEVRRRPSLRARRHPGARRHARLGRAASSSS